MQVRFKISLLICNKKKPIRQACPWCLVVFTCLQWDKAEGLAAEALVKYKQTRIWLLHIVLWIVLCYFKIRFRLIPD